MREFNLKLPNVIRLSLATVKRRRSLYANANTPNENRSSSVSLFLRSVFERVNIKKIIGVILTLLVITSSIAHKTEAFDAQGTSGSEILSAPLVLITKAGVQYPVKRVNITQGYRLYHKGIDIDGTTGDNIFPITAGKVESITYSRFGYGNYILINHGGNIKSLYAHM